MIYKNHLKFYFDIFFAWTLLIVLFPLIFCICVCLFMTQGKSILYIQERSGKCGTKFKMVKFRTLNPSMDLGLSLKNRKYTVLGKIMRRIGLDELPQLWNIIKGEMSFIGPRPLPIEYVEKYNNQQLKRLKVMPGITGWAQIHGRNDISWKKRFELDNWYAEHINIMLDMQIFALTVVQICSAIIHPGKRIYEMPAFNGSN